MANGRVYRGGSWYHVDASALAARARGRNAPSVRYYSLGFRCVHKSTAETSRTYKGGGRIRSSPSYRNLLNPYYNLGVLRFRTARRVEET